MPPSIEILIDERDPYPDGYHYLIWGLKAAWEQSGRTVRVARGLRALKGADLVIPHFDLTVTPGPVRYLQTPSQFEPPRARRRV